MLIQQIIIHCTARAAPIIHYHQSNPFDSRG